MKTKKYSVVLLMNKDGSKVLLEKKDRTSFAGKLNGVGGKIEDNEDPYDGALREIFEESSIPKHHIRRFSWLGTLIISEQCDLENSDKCPELWFFTGIVEDESEAVKPESSTEEIGWYEIDGNGKPITHGLELAGDGDVEYFIRMARRILFNII